MDLHDTLQDQLPIVRAGGSFEFVGGLAKFLGGESAGDAFQRMCHLVDRQGIGIRDEPRQTNQLFGDVGLEFVENHERKCLVAQAALPQRGHVDGWRRR